MERGWIFINARELRLNRLDRLVNEYSCTLDSRVSSIRWGDF